MKHVQLLRAQRVNGQHYPARAILEVGSEIDADRAKVLVQMRSAEQVDAAEVPVVREEVAEEQPEEEKPAKKSGARKTRTKRRS